MKNKTTVVALTTLLLVMAAPAHADVITDQSRIWLPKPQWAGLETVALPVRGTCTQQ